MNFEHSYVKYFENDHSCESSCKSLLFHQQAFRSVCDAGCLLPPFWPASGKLLFFFVCHNNLASSLQMNICQHRLLLPLLLLLQSWFELCVRLFAVCFDVSLLVCRCLGLLRLYDIMRYIERPRGMPSCFYIYTNTYFSCVYDAACAENSWKFDHIN